MILRHFPAVFTQFAYFSTGFHSTSSYIHSTCSFHSLKIATRFNQFPNPGGGGGGTQVCKYYSTIIYNSYILQRSLFPGFLHFDLVSSAYHDISCIFPFHFSMVLMQFPMIFISSVLRRFLAFSHVSALISSAYHDFSSIFAIFSIVSCIFLCFALTSSAYHGISYMFTICSSVVRCFSIYSHVFALISSACHDISCILTIVSSVLRQFPAFSYAFALTSSAYHGISYMFQIFSSVVRCFPAFSHVFALFLHFPMFLLSFPLLTILFPAFSPYFMSFFLLHFLFTSSGLPYFPAFSHAFTLISSPIIFPACSQYFSRFL